MKKILVTGANGQLGLCLQKRSKEFKTLDFTFLDSKGLDITNINQIKKVFANTQFDYCINCAAYTAVDKAEDERQLANRINNLGVGFLAEFCQENSVVLIHVSTDFVFDGNITKPYSEEDITNPLGVYGETKLEGEKKIRKVLKSYYIIRTSWLYSCFGNNFFKTMLNFSQEKNELNIVNDQKGTPTNANDLAAVIIKIIESKDSKYGTYHYSNLGEATWFEFAMEIFKQTNTKVKVKPINTNQYVVKAIRPKYSVLDKSRIINCLDVSILDWKESLKTLTDFYNL